MEYLSLFSGVKIEALQHWFRQDCLGCDKPCYNLYQVLEVRSFTDLALFHAYLETT